MVERDIDTINAKLAELKSTEQGLKAQLRQLQGAAAEERVWEQLTALHWERVALVKQKTALREKATALLQQE
ncbi:hypothetical protein MNEG_8282, partial [Monoraphidium neglectum]